MARLIDIEGVGETYAGKLEAAGIHGTQNFLKLGASRQGRKQIAEKTGIEEKQILKWLNRVDLYRIKGVGSEYSDLLEAAGVDTVAELACRNPENLYKALVTVNTEKKLVRKMPTPLQVAEWIAQSGTLPKMLTY